MSIRIFGTFACRDFGGDFGSFLKVDYSIDCSSERHATFQIYAIIMVLVYPVGVPLMYGVLLYRKRAMLDPGQWRFTHELGSEEHGRLKALAEREKLELGDPGLASLSFLYDAYEPRCYCEMRQIRAHVLEWS